MTLTNTLNPNSLQPSHSLYQKDGRCWVFRLKHNTIRWRSSSAQWVCRNFVGADTVANKTVTSSHFLLSLELSQHLALLATSLTLAPTVLCSFATRFSAIPSIISNEKQSIHMGITTNTLRSMLHLMWYSNLWICSGKSPTSVLLTDTVMFTCSLSLKLSVLIKTPVVGFFDVFKLFTAQEENSQWHFTVSYILG